jgi:hypothetical protein
VSEDGVSLFRSEDLKQAGRDNDPSITTEAAKGKSVRGAALNDPYAWQLEAALRAEPLDKSAIGFGQAAAMVVPADVRQPLDEPWAAYVLDQDNDKGERKSNPEGSAGMSDVSSANREDDPVEGKNDKNGAGEEFHEGLQAGGASLAFPGQSLLTTEQGITQYAREQS